MKVNLNTDLNQKTLKNTFKFTDKDVDYMVKTIGKMNFNNYVEDIKHIVGLDINVNLKAMLLFSYGFINGGTSNNMKKFYEVLEQED